MQNGETIGSVTLASPGSAPTAPVAGSPYVIIPTFSGGSWDPANYTISFTGKLRVAPAQLTLTGDYTKSYGQSANLDPARLGIAGVQNGETIGSVTLASPGSAPTAPVAGSPYAIIPIFSGGSWNPANYTISFNGQLRVLKAALMVTAEDKTRAYQVPNPPLTAAYTGFVNGETLAGAAILGSPDLSTAAILNSPVGSYPITVSVDKLSAPNYSFLPANGTLSIQALPITITVNASRYYGVANGPVFTKDFNITKGSLGAGDAISQINVLKTATSANTPVGPYLEPPIGPCLGYLQAVFTPGNAGNYEITYLYTLTILKKPVTVTAEDKTRAYQTPNPPLSAVYTGFVNGETFASAAIQGSPDLSTVAILDSPAGSYQITVSVAKLSAPNYSFIAANGNLYVVQSCQEIIFPQPGDRTYGDPPSVIQASACSGLGITLTIADPNQAVATIAGNILTITGTGSLVITASQGGSANLDLAPEVSRTLVVHKSGQAITFPSLPQKLQGDLPFALNASSSSALPVSYQSSDPSVAEINGSTVTLTGAGTTVITAWQAGNDNYNAALPSSQPLVVAEEGAPPLLSLSTLSTGAVTADPVLNIMGTASDASGIASLTVNGVDLTERAPLFSSAVVLVPGKNSIEVTAWDGEGNRTLQTLDLTLDAAAPEISLSTPADNSVTDLPLFWVNGTVTPGASVTIVVNGSAAQPLTVTDGAFTGSGSLEQGVNTIAFSAALSGRVSQVKRSVTLAPGGPYLAILEPAEDIRTEQNSVSINGIAGGGGGGGSVALEVAGSRFAPTLQAGAFQQTVVLDHAGAFRITVRATDSGGISSLAQRNIIRVPVILGDLDGDGCVDIRDAMAALRISLGMETASAQALTHGDVAPLVNGVPQPDGKIDAGDVLLILRKIVGLVDF